MAFKSSVRTAFTTLVMMFWTAGVIAAPYDIHDSAPTPVLFAPGIISTPNDEVGGTFSPDGADFYFVVYPAYTLSPRFGIICVSHFSDGRWQTPVVVSFSGNTLDFPPHLSPDGKQLFFASSRPAPGSSKHLIRIWVTRKIAERWDDPTPLPSPINTDTSWNIDPSVTSDGTLYFSSNRDDKNGHFHIYRARRRADRYEEPAKLGLEVNSDFNDSQAFVSPDEGVLLFTSSGTLDLGSGKRQEELIAGGSPYPREDIYVSERRNGSWTTARHLENGINTFAADTYPSITPDGRYLFFSSERSIFDIPTPHAIASYEFEELVRSTLNGHGNIYFVDFSTLGVKG